MSRLEQPISEEHMMLAAGYVLGDLDPEEATQFEVLMSENPKLLAEVNALQVSLGLIPLGLTQFAPPPLLKDKILTAHTAENAIATLPVTAPQNIALNPSVNPSVNLSVNSPVNPSVNAPANAPMNPSVDAMLTRRPTIPWAKIIAGIAVLGALLLGADNFRLRQSIAQKAEADRVAAILQRPTSRLVSLQGQGNAAAGTLLFTPGKWQEVVVSLGDLPPLPPDQVYRMWLTINNGTVIPCGEFNTNAQGDVFVTLRPAENPPKGTKATGIYVTIDRADAPLNPTGQRIMTGSI